MVIPISSLGTVVHMHTKILESSVIYLNEINEELITLLLVVLFDAHAFLVEELWNRRSERWESQSELCYLYKVRMWI